jgi:hypothetical protein
LNLSFSQMVVIGGAVKYLLNFRDRKKMKCIKPSNNIRKEVSMRNVLFIMIMCGLNVYSLEPDCSTYYPLHLHDSLFYRGYTQGGCLPSAYYTLVRSVDSIYLHNDTMYYAVHNLKSFDTGSISSTYDRLFVYQDVYLAVYGNVSTDSIPIIKPVPIASLIYSSNIPCPVSINAISDSCYQALYSPNPYYYAIFAKGVGEIEYHFEAHGCLNLESMYLTSLKSSCYTYGQVINKLNSNLSVSSTNKKASYYDIRGRKLDHLMRSPSLRKAIRGTQEYLILIK